MWHERPGLSPDSWAEQLGFGWPEEIVPAGRKSPSARDEDGHQRPDQGALPRAASRLRRADAPIKRIARIANSNERAAKDWWGGKNLPNAVHLLKLMAQVPEFAGEVRRLTGMEADLEPEFAAAFNEAMRAFSKLKGR